MNKQKWPSCTTGFLSINNANMYTHLFKVSEKLKEDNDPEHKCNNKARNLWLVVVKKKEE